MTVPAGWLLALAASALLAPACQEETEPEEALPLRHERYGILRDLVLFKRRSEAGGPFFLDRFETTQRDWETWLRAQGRATNGPTSTRRDAQVAARRPVTGKTLPEARRFASWRFCRVQRLDEWEHARTSGGIYLFPWGNRWQETKCNTRALGLDRTAPVGSFASGRGPGGTYDLVGNVQEWTETVPVPPRVFPRPFLNGGNKGRPATLYMPGETELRSTFGISCWLQPWLPAPTMWLVVASPTELTRLVVGGHFRTRIQDASAKVREPFPTDKYWRWRDRTRTPDTAADPFPNPEQLAPQAYSDLTGVRLASDPESLLVALLREPGPPGGGEAALLRRFLARPEHRQVLREACGRARAQVPDPGPLSRLIRAELGR